MLQVRTPSQTIRPILSDAFCSCHQDIVGALFHCVDCEPVNIDICSNCENAGLPGNLDASDGGHHSKHRMLKVTITALVLKCALSHPLTIEADSNAAQQARDTAYFAACLRTTSRRRPRSC